MKLFEKKQKATNRTKVPSDVFTGMLLYENMISLDLERFRKQFNQAVESNPVFKPVGTIDTDATSSALEAHGSVVTLLTSYGTPIIIQRIDSPFPKDQLELKDDWEQLIAGHRGSIAVASMRAQTPMETLVHAIAVTLALYVIHRNYPTKSLIWGPSAAVIRTERLIDELKQLAKQRVYPIRLWNQILEHQPYSEGIYAATVGLSNLFGCREIEIWNSPRMREETFEILDCAILDTIANGPIDSRGKFWETRSGVVYTVRTKRSVWEHGMKVTRLVEVVK